MAFRQNHPIQMFSSYIIITGICTTLLTSFWWGNWSNPCKLKTTIVISRNDSSLNDFPTIYENWIHLQIVLLIKVHRSPSRPLNWAFCLLKLLAKDTDCRGKNCAGNSTLKKTERWNCQRIKQWFCPTPKENVGWCQMLLLTQIMGLINSESLKFTDELGM